MIMLDQLPIGIQPSLEVHGLGCVTLDKSWLLIIVPPGCWLSYTWLLITGLNKLCTKEDRYSLSCLNQIQLYVNKLIHIGKQHINDIGIFEAMWCYTLVADYVVSSQENLNQQPGGNLCISKIYWNSQDLCTAERTELKVYEWYNTMITIIFT